MIRPRRSLLAVLALLLWATTAYAGSRSGALNGPEPPKPSGGKCSVAYPGR